jgi:type IV secretion system protein TrbL
VPTANNPATIAAIAKILSSVPTVAAAAGAVAGLGAAGRVAAGAAAVDRPAIAGAAGAAAVRGGAAGAGRAAVGAVGAPVGPPGGSVGNLIVGAALGLGGSVMRTVSFFGATLPVVFLPGSAPSGTPGMFGGFGGTSAINIFLKINCVHEVSNSYSYSKK